MQPLTLSQRHFKASRMMQALDFPVGDPFGGPAYGRFEKGGGGLGMVVGVVASVATMGAGAAAWAAASASGLTAATALSAGAMVAGGAMSGIGLITGNKKLSRIGGVLSLAGGIGGSLMDVSGNAINPLAEGGAKSLTSTGISDAMKSVSDSFAKATDALGFGKDTAKLTNDISTVQPGVTGGSPMSGAADPLAKAATETTATAPTFGQSISADPFGASTPSWKIPTDTGTGTALPNLGAQAAAKPGILGQAMDFAKSTGGGLMAGQLISGLGAGISNQQLLDQYAEKYGNDQALLQQQLKNVNFQYQVIDPNDPQAAQKQAQAKAAGIPTITIGVNQNADVQTPTNAFKPQGV